MRAARVDPKAWFSAERTFLHWAKISVVFAASSALLLSAAGSSSQSTYEAVPSGSCEAPVTSGMACTVAATMVDVPFSPPSAQSDGLKSSPHAPPYCYIEDGVLKFNAGGNTGDCTESQQCVCAVSEPDWYLFIPAGVIGFASLLVLGHAYRKHIRRVRSMGSEGGKVLITDFADKTGAYMLAVTLTLGVAGLIAAPVLSNQAQ